MIDQKRYFILYFQSIAMEPIYKGANIFWEIKDDTLFLSGSGDMIYKFDEEKQRISIPWYYEDFTKVVFEGNITSIGPETFHTSDLTEIVIPDSVTKIENLAFCSCKSLWKVIIGSGVTMIDYYAFSYCENLKILALGKNLKTIGYNAFLGCTSLKKVEFPCRLRIIDDCAFGNCTSLKRIYIKNTISSIKGNPFIYCTSMKEIKVAPGVRNYSSFNGCLVGWAGSTLYSVPGGLTGEMSFGPL